MSKNWKVEYIDGPGVGYYVIVIGEWEDAISQDSNYDPFETEEAALRFAEENLK